MIVDRQTVEGEILPTARQRFLGKIGINRSRSDRCRANGKGTCVGKTIQETLRSDLAHVAPIFPLIDKQADGVTGPEVDSKFEIPLRGDRPQIFACVAKAEKRDRKSVVEGKRQ